MFWLFNKLFVRPFYAANAGFFLFFFFLFFGAVQGGSLVGYHLSLMRSILGSYTTLTIVLLCWSLYHIKCLSFVFKTINSDEGSFLYNLQTVDKPRQWLFYVLTYLQLYAPVLLYAILLSVIGLQWNFWTTALIVLLYQLVAVALSVAVIHRRMNNWIATFRMPSLTIAVPKNIILLSTAYFANEKKVMLCLLKAFSLLLLYIVFFWNEGKYNHDSFMLFYLLNLLAHAILPYQVVDFFERQFSAFRNLPIPFWKRGAAFVLTYMVLLLPELIYLIYAAGSFSFEHRFAYYLNLIASLFLLTAVQYANASDKNEYLKACFGLVFFSIFALHSGAFWLWIIIQLSIAIVLFTTGYYRYESKNES